ncbi:small ribosomal subunit protein uS9m-like isoform X1 [Artemia franciscana]|uniref:small ribosomal subunit protein uS9m-like isoform X1 n=1 Tax=Artemia franciscana TaxID=6661 RepID=UPI0032DA22FC
MALQKSALNRSLFKVKNLLSSGINTRWASNEGSTVEKDSFGSPVPYDTSLEPKKEQKINKAMEAYLERARKYNAFYKEQLADFEIRKRHLANMMGQDPEFFTQKDIDEAIEYLFPSGLFEPRARPMMKHPDKIFPRRKEAEFDESGRPFHPLFYTVQPNFYQTLSDMVAKLRALDVHEDKMIREGKHFVDKKEFLISEDWITADKLSMMLVEKLNDFHRAQFVKTIERLTNHNYGYLEKDYINGFRRVVASQFEALEAPDLMYNSEGRPFMTSYGRRKSCWSKATVVGNGVGKYVINGVDFRDMFPRQQDREQLLFPSVLLGHSLHWMWLPKLVELGLLSSLDWG